MFIQALAFLPLVAAQPTTESVLEMMRDLPAVEGRDSTHVDFSHRRDAPEIATAIADVSANMLEAKVMVVYAAYESGFKRDAIGDHGLSFGAWQMRGLPLARRFDVVYGARVWIRRARQAAVDCASLPFEERLAPLASGNCDHARQKTRWRVELAERL